MMDISNAIKQGFSGLVSTVRQESPSILTALGVTGLASTVILAVKATPVAIQMIENEEAIRLKEQGTLYEAPSKMDIVKLTWKQYIPTAISGVATAACIIGSNSVNLRRQAALTSLYSLSESALKTYQEKVKEIVGEKKEEKIRDSIAQDRLNDDPIEKHHIILTGFGETQFYDSLSGRYFLSDLETVRQAVNNFNEELLSDMYKSLNELYFDLGLPEIQLGEKIGWNVENGLLEIYFSPIIATNKKPCIVLEFRKRPKPL